MADNNNSQFQTVEVVTNGLNIFGKDNMMMTRYLDDTISFSFCYPNDDQMTGKRTYPKENRISVVLRRDQVAALSTIIEEDLIPAIREGKNVSKGVFATRDRRNIVSIEWIEGIASLTYYKDIDEDRKTSKFFRFTFQPEMIVSKYNATTGSCDIEEVQASLFMFCHMIMKFESLIPTKIVAHGSKMGNAYTIQNEMNYLRSIAQKIGAQVQTYQSTGQKYNNSNDSGLPFSENANGATGASSPMAGVQEVNDFSGLIN